MRIEPTDAQLVAQLRAGSNDALSELFERHWRATWKAAFALCASRAVADDIAQDAFERALRQITSLNGDGQFGPWVKRIAINRTIDHLRRERRVEAIPTDLPDPDDRMGAAMSDPVVMRAVGTLPIDQRIPVVLRYWLDYTPDEIASVVGVPVGTVSSRLSRALAQLRTTLGDRDA